MMIVTIRVPDNATGIYYTLMEDGYENTDPKPVEMCDYIWICEKVSAAIPDKASCDDMIRLTEADIPKHPIVIKDR